MKKTRENGKKVKLSLIMILTKKAWPNGDKKSKNAKVKNFKMYLTRKWAFESALKNLNQYIENCRRSSILN